MNYREALGWLYGTQRFGIKLGLENSRRLLHALDAPSPSQRILHVAGTNGKGSVCAMLDSICRAAGHLTGLFTSPHLITFRERIRVGGFLIDEQAVADGLTRIRELTRTWEPHPTFFEITTALALDFFRRQNTEIVVLETGMGGRLDATNAVAPVVSVITPIDFDHQMWLGHTLAEIAAEKAGIIKCGTPVVSAIQQGEVAEVLIARAAELHSSLEFIAAPAKPRAVALSGAHQQENAALALAALQAAQVATTPESIDAGLRTVTWPARFQFWNEQVVIDGAHNPAGARVLAETWRQQFGDRRATLILGVLKEKDVEVICATLAPLARRVFLPRLRAARAEKPEELAAILDRIIPDLPVEITADVSEAIERSRMLPDPVLVAGSLHFAGEALAILEGKFDQLEESFQ